MAKIVRAISVATAFCEPEADRQWLSELETPELVEAVDERMAYVFSFARRGDVVLQ